MNLRQQIIQERVEKTARDLKLTEDMAFLRFAHSSIIGKSKHSFDKSDLIDGGKRNK